MIIRLRIIQLAAIVVPDSIFAVLTTGDNEIVGGVPVAAEDDAVMGFPAILFISWKGRNYSQIFIRCVEN